MWIVLITNLALGGYGDPVDGLSSYSERSLHMWNNAVRVAPKAFTNEYARGGCSFDGFEASEKTPKPPLYWNYGLNDAARYHSEDMLDNDHFSHDSSDGTPFGERLKRFYSSGSAGENIAWGYPDPFTTVMQGWMCSPGHRANIMRASYNELGSGKVGAYYTLDFGQRSGVEESAIAMALHEPEIPSRRVAFLGDFYDAEGAVPSRYVVVLDEGREIDLMLDLGAPSMGVYRGEATLSEEEGCHTYYFKVFVEGNETRFPEDGSYGWGDCDFDDADSRWFDSQWGDEVIEEGKKKKKLHFVSCSSVSATPTGFVGLWSLVGLFWMRRRSSNA